MCKGQCATTVTFWKEVGPARSEDDREDEPERRRFLARGYCVFNQAQVDNYEAKAPALLPEAERIAHAGAFYTRLSISTGHDGSEGAGGFPPSPMGKPCESPRMFLLGMA